MRKFELDKTCWGYSIRCDDPKRGHDHWLYVSKVHRDGTYDFTLDYTYAKYFSLKTAKKHLARLEATT